MIIDLLIGALTMAVLLFLVDYVRKEELALTWWQWVLTVLCLFYMVFVVEVFYGFLGEGVPQAAFVMVFVLGVPAAIWAALLARFVFASRSSASPSSVDAQS